MYLHCDRNDEKLSLHDCKAEEVIFENGVLSFHFPDGFWIISDHPENKLGNTVRTDASKVDFHIRDGEHDDIDVYIFSKICCGKQIRKCVGLKKLMDLVNSKVYRLEFIDTYSSYWSRLYKCWIWSEKKPFHKECELIIPTDNVTYHWNKLCPNYKW